MKQESPPNDETYAIILDAFGTSGDLNNVKTYADEMLQAGYSLFAYSFYPLLSALARNLQDDKIKLCLAFMKEKNVAVTTDLYNQVR